MQILQEYAALPGPFSVRLTPAAFPAPRLVALNDALARTLGLDPLWLGEAEGIAFLTHGSRPDGAAPVAMAYAGHQFGQFVPTLGDGRAMLVGELRDAAGGLHELHLKGSGPTPFSRRGDGKAALGPVLREYLVSEAMAALGVPATRALAALTTGETVWRDRPLPGGVIARVAKSHVRVGTFQFLAARGDVESLRVLVDHAVARIYPELAEVPGTDRALAFLGAVTARQAALVARWMSLGFVHGVMNTDNMSVAGETIDFGPCAFLDVYEPERHFSFIDERGRYAYHRQPEVALWNLARLAECLLPLIDPRADGDTDRAVEAASEVLRRFVPLYEDALLAQWRAKLGLTTAGEEDRKLVFALLDLMRRAGADFTLTFRQLSRRLSDGAPLFDEAFRAEEESWIAAWRARFAREGRPAAEVAAAMNAVNPHVIPRNHRIEEAIEAAVDGNYEPFRRLAEATAHPFDDAEDGLDRPPAPHERVAHTFCGT